MLEVPAAGAQLDDVYVNAQFSSPATLAKVPENAIFRLRRINYDKHIPYDTQDSGLKAPPAALPTE